MGFRDEISEKKATFLFFIPLVLLYAASYFERTAVPGMIFDELASSLAITASQVAAIGASFVYVYAIAQIFSGVLIDKYSGVRVGIAGGLVFAAGAVIMPLCGNVQTVCLARVLQGLGASTLYLSFINEIDRNFSRKNFAVFLSVAFFISNVGGIFGTMPFERLCRVFSWRSVLLCIGIASEALCFFTMLGGVKMNIPKVQKKKISFKSLFEMASLPLSWALAFCSCTNFCIFFVIQSVFGKKFLEDCGNMSSPFAASVMLFSVLTCMFTALASGFVTRAMHNRRKPLIVVASAVTFISTLLMTGVLFFKLPGCLFAAGYIMYAFSAGFCLIFSMLIQEYNRRSEMTQSAAMLNMACYFVAAACSRITGGVLDFFGGKTDAAGTTVYPCEAYLAIFLVALAVTLASLILSFFMPETRGHYVRRQV